MSFLFLNSKTFPSKSPAERGFSKCNSNFSPSGNPCSLVITKLSLISIIEPIYLYKLFWYGKFFSKLLYFFMHGFFYFFAVFIFQDFNHKLGNALAFFLFKTASGYGRRTEADAGGVQGLADIICNGIHIKRYAYFIQHSLRFFSSNSK